MKAFITSLFFFLVFLLGCSNTQSSIEEFSEGNENTLKKYLVLQTENLTWTEEIEPNVVSDKKKKDVSLFGNSRYSFPAAASVLAPSEEDYIFPEIEGLGYLDTSSINNSLLTLINNFCTELIHYSSNSQESNNSVFFNSFIKEQNYILTIFLYDIEKLPILSEYLIFSPYQDIDYLKIPVRLYSEYGHIDIEFYATETSQGWQFEQIKYGEFVNE